MTGSRIRHRHCGHAARRDTGLDVVTGAFSYSGAAWRGRSRMPAVVVRTITGHPGRAPAGTAIEVRPLDFDDPLGLVAVAVRCHDALQHLLGALRPSHASTTSGRSPTRKSLFLAAKRAGVQRIVHVSITHPSSDSPLPYFRGKALVERALAESDVSYAIVRPAILFGGDGVLHQQHRLAAPPAARLRHRRARRLPDPGHPRRRPGAAVPGQGRRDGPTA